MYCVVCRQMGINNFTHTHTSTVYLLMLRLCAMYAITITVIHFHTFKVNRYKAGRSSARLFEAIIL